MLQVSLLGLKQYSKLCSWIKLPILKATLITLDTRLKKKKLTFIVTSLELSLELSTSGKQDIGILC